MSDLLAEGVPSCLLAALAYAKQGWRVFPTWGYVPGEGCECRDPGCRRPGKHPRIAAWERDATTVESTLAHWWRAWPLANVATLCTSERFCFDADLYKDGAREVLDALLDEHGPLPDTVEGVTGGGGRHYWFAGDGARVPKRQGLVRKESGLDLCGELAYVMLPPSLTGPGVRPRHAWREGHRPAERALARAPGWLLDLARSPRPGPPPGGAGAPPLDDGPPELPSARVVPIKGRPRAPERSPEEARLERATAYVAACDPGVSGQGGHETTFKTFVKVIRGFSRDEVDAKSWEPAWRELLRGYNARCEPPWSVNEFEHKVKQAIDRSSQGWGFLLERPPPRTRERPKAAPRPVDPVASGGWGDDPDDPFAAIEGGITMPASEPGREPPDGPDWRKGFTKKGNGYHASPLAAALVLRNDPRWVGRLAYDDFQDEVVLREAPPCGHEPDWRGKSTRVLTDVDFIRFAGWIERNYRLHVTKGHVADACEEVGRERRFHPVRDYLNGLEWDGTKRVERWLIDYAGADDIPYHGWVGTWWLVSAVARVMRPGCTVEGTLVFEGVEGKYKSRVLRLLGGEWFSDSLDDITSKDAKLLMAGVWIFELPELADLDKATVAQVKRFLTQDENHFRVPYARKPIRVQRQSVFAGSTNELEYLRSKTGNRRFWPVRTQGELALDALARDRDQLWAEAKALYEAEVKWWPITDEEKQACAVAQAERETQDAWEAIVSRWLFSPTSLYANAHDCVFVPQVLEGAMGFEPRHIRESESVHMARVLGSLGWVRGPRTRMRDGTRISAYFAPGTPYLSTTLAPAQQKAQETWLKYRSTARPVRADERR